MSNHYTDGTTKNIEKFAGKTIQSFWFPDEDSLFDTIEILFTDGSTLEIYATEFNSTIGVSYKIKKQSE